MSSGDSDDVTGEEFFWNLWQEAEARGTLVEAKHDPRDAGAPRKGFRTVVAEGVLGQLRSFPETRQVHIFMYEQLDRSPGEFPYCWVIDTAPSGFSVAASGIPSLGPQPTSVCDRLIAVSGSVKGFHIYGAVHQHIQQRALDGKLRGLAEFRPSGVRGRQRPKPAQAEKHSRTKGGRPNLNKVRVNRKRGR